MLVRSSLVLALVVAAGPAMAQQAAQPAAQTATPPAARPQAPEPSAMERAQKAAANPMRVILEAARIKRRPDDAPDAAVDAAAVRRTAAREEAASRLVPGASAVATASTPPVSTAPPASPAGPAAATAAAPSADGGITVTPTLSSELSTRAPPRAAAALDSVAPVNAPAVPAAAVSPSVGPLVDARPRLVTMVEPEIPPRLLEQLPRNEVVVDMTIRRDGSVTDVNLLPPAPRTLSRYVVEALERWRFEPHPAERSHRVVLVFGAR